MPATSVYTKILQGIWNAINRDTTLSTFRATLNPGGGKNFDLSIANETLPRGEGGLPRNDESPAVAIVPYTEPSTETVTRYKFGEAINFRVDLWIRTREIDEYLRFLELTRRALLYGSTTNFVDYDSPALPNTTLVTVQNVEFVDGDMESILTDKDLWWHTWIGVKVTFRFDVA